MEIKENNPEVNRLHEIFQTITCNILEIYNLTSVYINDNKQNKEALKISDNALYRLRESEMWFRDSMEMVYRILKKENNNED